MTRTISSRTPQTFGMERLPFRLPDFVRVAWVSPAARQTWEPRFRGVSDALFKLQWASVRFGLRRCCKLVLRSGESFERLRSEFASAGLSCEPLQDLPATSCGGNKRPARAAETHNVLVAIGKETDVQRLRDAVRTGDSDTEMSLLGAHECCRSAFTAMWRQGRFIDFTWPIAVTSISWPNTTQTIEIEHSSIANPLWKWVGIRMAFTPICRFDCPAAVQSAEEIARLGIALDFYEEMEWAREILDWPVEWSALHGVAEVHSPVCKIIFATDATPTRYTVRVLGHRLPSEGSVGLAFPYTGLPLLNLKTRP